MFFVAYCLFAKEYLTPPGETVNLMPVVFVVVLIVGGLLVMRQKEMERPRIGPLDPDKEADARAQAFYEEVEARRPCLCSAGR